MKEIAKYYKEQIELNKDILLSSFGAKGIRKSENKSRLVINIIETVNDIYIIDALKIFYNILIECYRKDAQFLKFSKSQIGELGDEEQFYIIEFYKMYRRKNDGE